MVDHERVWEEFTTFFREYVDPRNFMSAERVFVPYADLPAEQKEEFRELVNDLLEQELNWFHLIMISVMASVMHGDGERLANIIEVYRKRMLEEGF